MQGPALQMTDKPATPQPRRPQGSDSAPGGNVVEIYSGIQGEGIHVGRRHIFLRLARCNLTCPYCDQPEARGTPVRAAIERTPGMRDFIAVPNPMSPQAIARAVLRLHRPASLHHALAVTGGEPLLQPAFLAALLPAIRRAGLPVMLETNGTLPDGLRRLLPFLDIVSMDFKLKSTTARPAPAQLHRRFLALAVRHRLEIYVKAVVGSATTTREIGRAVDLIAGIRKSVAFVLQPITSGRRRSTGLPSSDHLLRLQATAAKRLRDVRVIPQAHKIMGQH
jgi:organic radical activating enzyme